jgi:hypothetical protein
MESIIVSVKKLQMGMWSAFTNGRTLPTEFNDLKGYKLKFEHDDETFRFVIILSDGKRIFHEFDRHQPQMTSADVLMYSPMMYRNWSEFMDKIKGAI